MVAYMKEYKTYKHRQLKSDELNGQNEIDENLRVILIMYSHSANWIVLKEKQRDLALRTGYIL